MVFMTPDMLSITVSAYASLLLNQNKFQAPEATVKVSDLCPLNTTITCSTDTLSIALTNLPNPTACNYLLHSIKPPTNPRKHLHFPLLQPAVFLLYLQPYHIPLSNT